MPLGQRKDAPARYAFALALVGTSSALAGCQGSAEPSERLEAPIIGGTLDITHKGVVSLLKQSRDGFFPACSGTLLAPNLVLTAHHCVAALSSSDHVSVVCGQTQFLDVDPADSMLISAEANVGSEGLDPFSVETVWVPPGSSDVCGRDIALLLLSGSGVPADVATPIRPALGADLAPDEVFAAIGYGLQSPTDLTGKTAGHRMSVSNAKVYCDGAACDNDMVEDGEFIANSPVCSGDSGGPALDSQGRVSGVTSRGDNKCTLGIYSSVHAWREFIVQKAFVAADSGHYTPPAWAGPPPAELDGTIPGGELVNAAGAGGDSSSPDVLGLSCTGSCPDAYKCWAATGVPPGICVPECSASAPTCPADYACDVRLGACVATPHATVLPKSASCAIPIPGASGEDATRADFRFWWGFMALLLAWRGRRAAFFATSKARRTRHS